MFPISCQHIEEFGSLDFCEFKSLKIKQHFSVEMNQQKLVEENGKYRNGHDWSWIHISIFFSIQNFSSNIEVLGAVSRYYLPDPELYNLQVHAYRNIVKNLKGGIV